MCKCGNHILTPFCEAPGCEWPDDGVDQQIAVTDFLFDARASAMNGSMTFKQYLDLCVAFDPLRRT
jgi:hypothetical protein